MANYYSEDPVDRDIEDYNDVEDSWFDESEEFLKGLSEEDKEIFREATVDNVFQEFRTTYTTFFGPDSQEAYAAEEQFAPLADKLIEFNDTFGHVVNTTEMLGKIYGSIRVIMKLSREGPKWDFDTLTEMLSDIGNNLPTLEGYGQGLAAGTVLISNVFGASTEIIKFCRKVKIAQSNRRSPYQPQLMQVRQDFRQTTLRRIESRTQAIRMHSVGNIDHGHALPGRMPGNRATATYNASSTARYTTNPRGTATSRGTIPARYTSNSRDPAYHQNRANFPSTIPYQYTAASQYTTSSPYESYSQNNTYSQNTTYSQYSAYPESTTATQSATSGQGTTSGQSTVESRNTKSGQKPRANPSSTRRGATRAQRPTVRATRGFQPFSRGFPGMGGIGGRGFMYRAGAARRGGFI